MTALEPSFEFEFSFDGPPGYAFIGLGQLGRRLAASLLRQGLLLTVYDRNHKAAAPLVDAGAIWSKNAREAAAGCDGVITCLPSPAAIRAALTGEKGALAGMRPGSVWIEMSTNDPAEIRDLASLCATRGVETLEAPVTGGVHLATSGEITVLAGGDPALVEAHRPALEAMGNPVIHVGELGQASVMKVITNMLAFVHLVGAGEALMLARRAGIDLGVAFESIRESSGNSFVHETESQVILSGSYNIGFTMDLACKDASLATGFGKRFGVPLALGGEVREIIEEARRRYGGDAWSPMVVRLLEEATGEMLRAPGFPETLDPAESVEPD